MPHYKPGKLSHDKLSRLLRRLGPGRRSGVLIGPRIGEDAAAIDPGGRAVVVAADPVTFAADRVGWYAVHINANDVAAMGAKPQWFAGCVLLPAECPVRVERIFDDMAEACESIGAAVVGGHTEVTDAVSRPVVAGTMMGAVAKGRITSTGGVRPGDRIVMTQWAAIEATAIIAREKGRALAGRCPPRTLAEARRFLFHPGISVVREAMVAAKLGATAMHDPTEGGVVTGLWEMAQASGLEIRVELEAVPVHPHTARLCELTGLDPLRSIASGSLLIAIPAAKAERLMREMAARDIPAHVIGRAGRGRAGLRSMTGRPIPHSATDEITRL